MDCGAGDRGVSEVVGFILIFGMLVIAFTVYQGIVVPDQNRQVEFQHNQAVHGQLQDLRNAIVTTAATGSGQAVSVTLGASYPRRALAQNLGVSGGAIGTTELSGSGMVIENVSTPERETDDYIDGSLGPFTTRSVTYTPVYTFYSGAPETVYENSILYNKFGNANVSLADQVLFDGRQITLITLDGSLSLAQQDTVSVNTKPISVSTNRVPITNNDSARRIRITIPTTLSAEAWRDQLADQYDPTGGDPDAYVADVVDAGPNQVSFVLEQGETYDLRMSRIGLGRATATTGAHYLTIVSGNGSAVPAGDTQELVVEVRDRYNNPVSGVTVNVSDDGAGTVDESERMTDAAGRASFSYDAPSVAVDDEIVMNISVSPSAREEVTFRIDVQSTGGGGGGVGGDGAYDLEWTDPSGESGTQSGCTETDCTWDRDDDADSNVAITAQTFPQLDGMGVDFAVDNSSVAAIVSADNRTASDGSASVTLEARANGTVGVYAGSGGTSDLINLTLVNVSPSVQSADVLVGSTGPSTSSGTASTVGFGFVSDERVSFSVSNGGQSQVEVSRIEISLVGGGSSDHLSSWLRTEVSVSPVTGTTGSYDGTVDLDQSTPLDQSATIAAGSDATVELTGFEDGGNGDVDMSGEQLDVTFYFADGSQKTIRVTT